MIGGSIKEKPQRHDLQNFLAKKDSIPTQRAARETN